MRARLATAGAILLLVGTSASAHRLDEYLQAATISVERDRVKADIRLTPGIAVFPIVLANIDTNADGVISEAEQNAYAERVLSDLSLTLDGDRLQLRLVSSKFANIEEMKEGRGDILIEFDGDVTYGRHDRRLIFENRHQSRIAAYLVNCLVPSNPDIRVTAQNRNYEQSLYELDYVQSEVRSGVLSLSWWSAPRVLLGGTSLLLFAGSALMWRRRSRAANVIAQE